MVSSGRMERSEPMAHTLSASIRRRGHRAALVTLAAVALAFVGGPPQLFGQAAKPAATPKPLTPPPAAPSAADLKAPPATATKLPSGLSTLQLRPGKDNVPPRPQDWIAFFAIGRRTDGTVVQNTFASPNPVRMQMSRLIPAWQMAFAEMVSGEQRRFWFPAELAPKNPKTGEQESIVFDLELVGILRVSDPPASLKAPDPQAKAAGKGSWTLTIKEGKEGPKATRRDAALLNFTIWNDAGLAITTSALTGRPTLFPLDRVMPAFADCVEGMAIGERRNCWISSASNTGFPGASTGAIIFELELLNLGEAAKIFTPGAPKPGAKEGPGTPAPDPGPADR